MWRWFQKTYDKIDSWDFPEEWKPAIQQLNDMIPKVVADSLLAYIKDNYKEANYKAKDKVREIGDILKSVADKMN